MAVKVERGVGISWYLELQEALVSFGVVCHPTSVQGKPRSGRSDKRQPAERLVIQLRVRMWLAVDRTVTLLCVVLASIDRSGRPL